VGKCFIHKSADVYETVPKGLRHDIHRLGGLVRLLELAHPLAHKHEGDAAAIIAYHLIERAAKRQQARRAVHVTRDDARQCRRRPWVLRVFFIHGNPFGGCFKKAVSVRRVRAENRAAFAVFRYMSNYFQK